ncbi:hypothetical protein ACFY4F_27105 [Peribacillus butanolivorans]|uniref:hypothetical protein n=2 Tax=Peribacillus butanolivorans TaxID=421767 RepID=UPI0036BBC0BA
MLIKMKIDKVFYERDIETVCITTDVEEAIKVCKTINGDYNVSIWVNTFFLDSYMDIDEKGMRELFS